MRVESPPVTACLCNFDPVSELSSSRPSVKSADSNLFSGKLPTATCVALIVALAIFAPVTAPSIIFCVDMELLSINAVAIAPTANFSSVIDLSAILFVVTALLESLASVTAKDVILDVVTAEFCNFAVVTASLAIFDADTAESTIFACDTEISASLGVVIILLAILVVVIPSSLSLVVVIAPSTILSVETEEVPNFISVTAPSDNLGVVTEELPWLAVEMVFSAIFAPVIILVPNFSSGMVPDKFDGSKLVIFPPLPSKLSATIFPEAVRLTSAFKNFTCKLVALLASVTACRVGEILVFELEPTLKSLAETAPSRVTLLSPFPESSPRDEVTKM